MCDIVTETVWRICYDIENLKEVCIMMFGCQARPKTPTIIEKVCPQCGHEIEMFSIDDRMPCEHCGFVAYNDTLSCVQWCAHAKECVGEEMYNAMMEIVENQKKERRA